LQQPCRFRERRGNRHRAPSWPTPRLTGGLPHEYRDMPRI